MANPTGPQGEHPSTYLVQDRSSQDEFERVRIQGELVTASMGGPLPEQPRPETIHSVLDVGCGAGDWLLEVAATYPNITTLVGIDISSKMLAYARTRAEAHQIGKRVDFQVMDALRMLEFPSNTFELVNMRLPPASCANGTGQNFSRKSSASRAQKGLFVSLKARSYKRAIARLCSNSASSFCKPPNRRDTPFHKKATELLKSLLNCSLATASGRCRHAPTR
jgi:SAM-dependent methyltransferase